MPACTLPHMLGKNIENAPEGNLDYFLIYWFAYLFSTFTNLPLQLDELTTKIFYEAGWIGFTSSSLKCQETLLS